MGEYLVLLECKDKNTSIAVRKEYSKLLNRDADLGYGYFKVMSVDLAGRFICLLVVGNPTDLYWMFFDHAEAKLHDMALVGVTTRKLGRAPYKLDVLQMASGLSAGYVASLYAKLTSDFMASVDLSKYSDSELRRIISMCRLGDDPLQAEEGTLEFLRMWRNGIAIDRTTFWQNALVMGSSHHNDPKSSVDGDKVIIRVLAHLTYLDSRDVFAPRKSPIFKTVRRMILQ